MKNAEKMGKKSDGAMGKRNSSGGMKKTMGSATLAKSKGAPGARLEGPACK
jgi:hypothetical protein